jgi:farnesyl-diphosphate farnesyltransferase
MGSMPAAANLHGRAMPATPDIRPAGAGAAPTLGYLLRASSRTFALGIERLPHGLRDPVRVAYLLLRISDYLEDHETLQPRRKAELLRLWDRVLGGLVPVAVWSSEVELGPAPHADELVAANAEAVIGELRRLPVRPREIVTRHVRNSTRGMARWALRGPRIENEDDLDDYMFEVAGRVGYLLTELFATEHRSIRRRLPALMPLAREFGLGLQTVNVIRGLRADFQRGWIFVPDSFVSPPLTREALFQPGHEQQALITVQRLADKGARHLDAAAAYIRTIPRVHYRIRLFCLYPLLFAAATLALCRANPLVLSGEAKIARHQVATIVRNANLGGWSNRWIAWYCRRLVDSPP